MSDPNAIPATETGAGAANASSGSTTAAEASAPLPADALGTALPEHDPIIDAIKAYRVGMASYDHHPLSKKAQFEEGEEEIAIAETYGPPSDLLQAWDAPAVSHAGAIEALRLASSYFEGRTDEYIAGNMIAAALAYFEGGGAAMNATIERINDPLLDALQAHDKTRAEFLGADGYDNPEEERYSDSVATIAGWDKPASSLEGAIAAIRHIVSLTDGCDMPEEVAAMAKAALAYFQGATAMTTTDRPDAFSSLETDVYELACMAGVLGDMLDQNLVEIAPDGSKRHVAKENEPLTVVLTRGQLELLAFGWNDVIGRANRMKARFMDALDGKEAA